MVASSSTPHADDDQKNVIRAIKGDAEAYGKLYQQHLEAIFRYIYFRVGDKAEAEDLTEEVFLRAWEALSTYKPGQYPFRSWLYRIAHNLVIDHHRKRKPLTLAETDLSTTPSGLTPPEDMVMLRQNAAELAEAMRALDDDEQQIVLLRFVEGLSHRQVAEIIGKSEGASRVLQHRALTKLQRFLAHRKLSNG